MSLPPLEAVDRMVETDPDKTRRSRFMLALGTSALSKVIAVLVQILALPLALSSLGVQTYAVFLALQAFVGWIGLFGLGLVPSLPKFIAAARVQGDRAQERSLISGAVLAMALISSLVFATLLSVGWVFGPSSLVSAKAEPSSTVTFGYLAVTFASALALFTSLISAIRAGLQELHRSNACAIVGNILILGGLFYAAAANAPLWAFVLVINLPISVLLLLDLSELFYRRPYLLRGPLRFALTVRTLTSHSGNALAVQVAYSLVLYIPTLAVTYLSSPYETALYGSIALEIFVAISAMNLIFQPMSAAMADAYSHGNLAWVRRGYFRALGLVSVMGLGAVVVGGLLGPWLMRVWMGDVLQLSPLLGAAFGGFFLLLCYCQLHFLVLASIGQLPGVGKIYMLQGVAALTLGGILCVDYGALGMTWGLVLGMSLVGGIMPRRVMRALRVPSQVKRV